MAAELLPDQQAVGVLKENCILIQIIRNVIPVWRMLHAALGEPAQEERRNYKNDDMLCLLANLILR